jgi:predicted HTH transcriptional regulator
MIVPDLGLNALDPASVAAALNTFRHGINDSDFLRNAGLIRTETAYGSSEELITVAGLLLLGRPEAIRAKIPQAQFAISSTGAGGLSSTVKTETLNVLQAVAHCSEELAGKLPIDGETLHEILINAFMHRDYREKAITRITISDEEISFENPGALLAGLRPDNLLRAQPIYRNFRLAEGARQAGLCRKYGDGIDRIYYNSLSRGLDFPLIISDGDSFKITFSTHANTAFAQFVRGRSEKLDNLDFIIVLKLLQVRETCTIQDAASSLQRSIAESKKVLDQMSAENMIVADRNVYYFTPSLRSDLKIFDPDKRQMNLW